MKYEHRFRVQAPIEAVAEFHRQSASMAAITPPPVLVRVHQAPERLKKGDEMDFTLWLGPLPVRWLARIVEASPTGFIDRQVDGPFRLWIHSHTFIPVDEDTTEVRDEIEAVLRWHPWWWLAGLGMWLSLPLLFAFRAWKTKRLLVGHLAWIASSS